MFGIPGRVPSHEIQTGLHDKGSYFKVVGTFHQLVEPYVGRSLALHNAAHNVGRPRFKSFCECVCWMRMRWVTACDNLAFSFDPRTAQTGQRTVKEALSGNLLSEIFGHRGACGDWLRSSTLLNISQKPNHSCSEPFQVCTCEACAKTGCKELIGNIHGRQPSPFYELCCPMHSFDWAPKKSHMPSGLLEDGE